MKMINKKSCNNEKGIGLIELVTAVAIFSMVVMMVSGIFINAIKGQQMISARQNVIDDVSYTAEFMVKELRMAQENSLDENLTFSNGAGSPLKNTSSSAISFINSSSDTVTYSLSGDKILRNGEMISTNKVLIKNLRFTVNNWNLTGGPAPFVTIFISAESVSGTSQPFKLDLQTTVSPRTY